MAVSDYLKPGLSERQAVKVMTVDVANKRIEGMLKDGSAAHIAVWDQPHAFRWPIENETWIIRRDHGIWMLDKRVPHAKAQPPDDNPRPPVTNMRPGDLRLDSDTITDARGYLVASVAGTPIDGASIAWSHSLNAFVPGAGGAPNIPDGFITGSMIALNTISGANIGNATITSGNITTGAITGSLIAADTIQGGNIAHATITSGNITTGAITGSLIATNAISSTNIQQGTIQTGNISTGAVTGDIIAINTIVGENIQNATIGGNNIRTGTLTGDLIELNTITGDRIAPSTITGTRIATGTITGSLIVGNTIVAGLLAAGAVIAGNIDTGAVTAATIAAGAVTASAISVTSLAAISATLGAVNAGTITASTLTGNTITGGIIQTASSAPRIVLAGATNDLRLYNASNQVIVKLDTTYGLQITSGAGTLNSIDWAIGGVGGTWSGSVKSDGGSGAQFVSINAYGNGGAPAGSGLAVNAAGGSSVNDYVNVGFFNGSNVQYFNARIIDATGLSQFLQFASQSDHARRSTTYVGSLIWPGGTAASNATTISVPGATGTCTGVAIGGTITYLGVFQDISIVNMTSQNVGSVNFAGIGRTATTLSSGATCPLIAICWEI